MFAHLIIYVLLFLQSEGRANRPGGGGPFAEDPPGAVQPACRRALTNSL